MSESPSPLQVPSQDPGDDVARRFRYQWGCGAIVALQLLPEDSEFEEVYCEHHEDILIRRKDGKFIGRQVKTRELHRGPFKSSDPEIRNALSRFSKLERDFGSQFEKFAIATNAGFFEGKDDPGNLAYLCQLARVYLQKERPRLTGPLKAMVNGLSSEAGCDKTVVVRALAKTDLNGSLHALGDDEVRVVRELEATDGMASLPLEVVTRLARALIDHVQRASTKPRPNLSSYFEILHNPQGSLHLAAVNEKRILREHVTALLEQYRSEPSLLVAGNHVTIESLPRGIRKLELKMAAGKLHKPNIDLAKDLKASTEHLLQTWYHKHGAKRANEMYQNARTAVRSECQRAYDDFYKSEVPFGQDMLQGVRTRITTRKRTDVTLAPLSEDHLAGMAGILTEDCEIWWSDVFEIPPEGGEGT